jgi:diaminohydroxyphosphoribosylaminopyrimidine deaminase/5-amino-6-(5-phosphoribosylamino)uracil reductase
MFSAFDTRMMARALQLARRGRYWASPNPHVGCVLALGDEIIGEGFTQPAGGNHAEIEALSAAADARGATAYVTLEPCNHHGRTAPCTEALLAAGVKRVVAALTDPNPQVAGGGLARLQAAGVEVAAGLLADEARAVLPGFLARMERGRGRVRVKLAASLDGRTAMASGESRWITGAAARSDVQRLRAESCAIVTGIGTVLADDCSLTVRAGQLGLDLQERRRATRRRPLRVVLDTQLQTPPTAAVVAGSAPTLICHGAAATGREIHGAELLVLPGNDSGVDLDALMQQLAARQCNEILVESGPRLAGALLRAGLVDELLLYLAPTLLGSEARPLLELPLQQMGQQRRLSVSDWRRVGDDWRLTLAPTGTPTR